MNQNKHVELTGGCLCGGVRYELATHPKTITACHCSQCRRMTGHYMAAALVKKSKLNITESRGLSWYRSSSIARRGFCNECGSTLFWDGDALDEIGIAAGTLDDTSEIKLTAHVFAPDKGDYYEITDGLPQYESDEELNDHQ